MGAGRNVKIKIVGYGETGILEELKKKSLGSFWRVYRVVC